MYQSEDSFDAASMNFTLSCSVSSLTKCHRARSPATSGKYSDRSDEAVKALMEESKAKLKKEEEKREADAAAEEADEIDVREAKEKKQRHAHRKAVKV